MKVKFKFFFLILNHNLGNRLWQKLVKSYGNLNSSKDGIKSVLITFEILENKFLKSIRRKLVTNLFFHGSFIAQFPPKDLSQSCGLCLQILMINEYLSTRQTHSANNAASCKLKHFLMNCKEKKERGSLGYLVFFVLRKCQLMSNCLLEFNAIYL